MYLLFYYCYFSPFSVIIDFSSQLLLSDILWSSLAGEIDANVENVGAADFDWLVDGDFGIDLSWVGCRHYCSAAVIVAAVDHHQYSL